MQSNRSSIPVYMIGAGGIVNDAHLPAYQLAGFTVAGIYDVDVIKARVTAARFGIPAVYDELPAIVQAAGNEGIFDIAVPADRLPWVLQALPHQASVLMQKPMGRDYAQAKEILAITREKKMTAAVNFQLRYAPFITAARKLIDEGVIGELCDIEVNVNVHTPWDLWEFLYQSPRVEILYHSIHYIDLIRQLAGNPIAVFAKTMKHPLMKALASVRSNIIMDYGDQLRANILTNHCHVYGLQHQHSFIKLEGTKGAIRITMGVLMNYPQGVADQFEYTVLEKGNGPVWKTLPLEGSWFPHAFMGSMQQIMDAKQEITARPDNSVEDAIDTMACVEAAYLSEGRTSVLLKDIN